MPALKALAAQLLAWGVLLAARAALGLPPAATLPLAALQGLLAAGIAVLQRAERWWLAIHLVFSPALLAALRLELPPAVPLAVLAALTFVFWTTFRGEVPLFLSSRAAADALAGLLPAQPGLRVIDLGAGTGALLCRLARARPQAHFTGIEHAPLPWLIARLRARTLPNVTIRRGDLWREPLGDQDLVYVFLSPRVMPRLWRKARAEMRPGSLLVSNGFPVPDVRPAAVIRAADGRGTRLYCYRM